jgi:hypothetical protein
LRHPIEEPAPVEAELRLTARGQVASKEPAQQQLAAEGLAERVGELPSVLVVPLAPQAEPARDQAAPERRSRRLHPRRR